MIILPPYISDRDLYHLVPIEHRWVMNKLSLAERMGHACGPTGMDAPKSSYYCIRPVTNLWGSGLGGFEKVWQDEGKQFENKPGYFWCEWFDGRHDWTEFVNDEPVRQGSGTFEDDKLIWEQTYDYIEMPQCLQGLSRYMLIESIGGNIIEASFRLLRDNACDANVEDYRQIDPTYNPTLPFKGMANMRMVPHEGGGHWWEELYEERTPWSET
jgi:hypothetical protein